MNFAPDCERAYKYHKTFYDDILNCLYLDESSENIVKI